MLKLRRGDQVINNERRGILHTCITDQDERTVQARYGQQMTCFLLVSDLQLPPLVSSIDPSTAIYEAVPDLVLELCHIIAEYVNRKRGQILHVLDFSDTWYAARITQFSNDGDIFVSFIGYPYQFDEWIFANEIDKKVMSGDQPNCRCRGCLTFRQ